MSREWRDMIVGDRMTVDQAFAERVEHSRFSRQEWGLVMTAVELEIEQPEDDERARLVADTEQLPHVVPELENVREGMGAMGAGAGAAGGDRSGRDGSGSGVLDSLRGALGLGGDDGPDEEELEAAKRLADAYAEALQRHLEQRGRWAEVRAAARE
jgi:hypothetical protein